MFGQDLSRVSNIDVSSNELCDVLLWLIIILLLLLLFLLTSSWFGSGWLLALLALLLPSSIISWWLTKELLFLGLNLVPDSLAISPLQLCPDFGQEGSEVKVILLLHNGVHARAESRLDHLCDLFSCDDDANSSCLVHVLLNNLVLFSVGLLHGVDELETFIKLLHFCPLLLRDLEGELSLVRGMLWLTLGRDCIEETAHLFWALLDSTAIKNLE